MLINVDSNYVLYSSYRGGRGGYRGGGGYNNGGGGYGGSGGGGFAGQKRRYDDRDDR